MNWARLGSSREFSLLVLLLAVVVLVTGINHSFLAPDNVRDVLIKAAPAVIVGCGLTLVVVTGEIDISMGSLMGLLAVVMGLCTSSDFKGWSPAIGILITLGLGALVGLVNGLLVVYGRVPSIIVTLGMLTALKGVTTILSGGNWIEHLPDGLRQLGTGAVAGVPIPVLVAALVLTASAWLATSTALGRRIYAVGSNPAAARLSGLKVGRIKLFVFALTGFLTAVATLVSATKLAVIEAGTGQNFELLAVTCVVVGGTAINGGRGNVMGTAIAAVLLAMIGTALIFLRLGPSATYWEQAIQGAFILAAVLADHLLRGQRKVTA